MYRGVGIIIAITWYCMQAHETLRHMENIRHAYITCAHDASAEQQYTRKNKRREYKAGIAGHHIADTCPNVNIRACVDRYILNQSSEHQSSNDNAAGFWTGVIIGAGSTAAIGCVGACAASTGACIRAMSGIMRTIS